MLEYIRNRAHGIIAWIIVSGLILTFGLWGIHQYFGGGANPTVAKVNGTPITQQQLQFAYYQYRQRLEQMLGSNFNPQMFPEAQMKQQVLQSLITKQMLIDAAHKAGLRVSDAQLGAVIRGINAFQRDGKFSEAAYEAALRAQGLGVQRFEHDFRRELAVDQLRGGVENSAFATDSEAQAFHRLQAQTRDVGYLVVPFAGYEKGVKVSDKEIQAYYDGHPDAFKLPEEVKVAYLELSRDAIANTIKVSDATLRQHYEQHKQAYTVPEERRARHILITVPKDADKATVEKARKKAEDLLAKLHNGASFAALAKKYSQDPGSADKGGDLGFFQRGAMTKAFADAVFSLKKPGQIAGPVRSPYGFHIIQLEAIRPSKMESFDQVKAQIKREIQQNRAYQQFSDEEDRLNNITYEHPDTLTVAADQLGLTIKHSDYFSRSSGKGIFAKAKVVRAAFSSDVLQDGNNSDLVELSPGNVVVLRVEGHRPARRQKLSAVRDEIIKAVTRQKAIAAAKATADALLKSIREGADPAKLGADHQLKWTEAKSVGRQGGDKVPSAVVHALFAMPRPDGKKPSLQRVALADGDQAVVALEAVQAPKPAKSETTVADQLAKLDGQAAFDAMRTAIRERSDIEIHGKSSD